MVTKTVGSGGDYATWGSAITWLQTVDPLADDYTFTQISSVTETSFPFVNINLNGRTLLLTSNNKPNGDPTSGWTTTINTGVQPSVRYEGNGGTVVLDGLYTVSTVAGQIHFLIGRHGILGTTSETIVRNCLFKGFGNIAPAFNGGVSVRFERDSDIIKMYNCKIWDMDIGLRFTTGTGGGPATLDKIYENITAYNCNAGVYINSPHSFKVRMRNVVAFDSVNFDWQYVAGDLTDWEIYNCADSDDSIANINFSLASNIVNNINSTTEFESTVDTEADFLKLNEGSLTVGADVSPEDGRAELEVQFTDQTNYSFPSQDLASNGMAPNLTAVDIEGLSIPNAEGFYSIGCHQAEIAIVGGS